MSTLRPSQPILIVDDESAILLAIDTALQMAGFSNTLTCQDSRQVMDLLANNRIEVLLLDLTMPHIDGGKLLDQVSREFPEIPVITVSFLCGILTSIFFRLCTRAPYTSI